MSAPAHGGAVLNRRIGAAARNLSGSPQRVDCKLRGWNKDAGGEKERRPARWVKLCAYG